MGTVQKNIVGKNKLWAIYQNAAPIRRAEIILELKKEGLLRHWHDAASKEGHNLHRAKAPLRDIFLKVMPETASLFGVKS